MVDDRDFEEFLHVTRNNYLYASNKQDVQNQVLKMLNQSEIFRQKNLLTPFLARIELGYVVRSSFSDIRKAFLVRSFREVRGKA